MVEGGDLEEEPERTEAERPGHRLIGYASAGAVVLIAVAAAIALLAGGSGGPESAERATDDATSGADDRERLHDLLPENGRFPAPVKVGSVREGARAAGCELESYTVPTKEHIANPDEQVPYKSDPPTSGKHHPVPAEDHAYAVAPDVRRIVHTLEHGRVVVWFDRDLPRSARAGLKAFYSDEPYQLLLVPDTTGMPYAVAATAWHRTPTPNGTGRLLGCPEYNDDVYTALAAFRDRNRNQGPELRP
jgi:hypothetical protein